MKIGIPRAFLYFKYKYLWETFFENLGVNYVISDETNKQIIKDGNKYSIDEACLSSKIYMGHVYNLIGKCDYILVPRIEAYTDGEVCTKFQAIYDLVANTFKDINILYYNINPKEPINEFRSFLKMGKFLGYKKSHITRAYLIAKQAEKTNQLLEYKNQEKLFEKEEIKILLVGHKYNIYDQFIGLPIINYLKEQNATIIVADICEKKEAVTIAKNNFPTLPWAFNKELVGSLLINKDKVDGIILMSSFPCGPDSLVNEMIIRKIKGKPILNLLLDDQDGNAGIETRLESFIDIIRIKKGDEDEV